MAITHLSTNFVDDIIDTSVNAHRKYKMTAVSGETDTYELEDKTTYTQQGTPYNASVVNNTNGTINQVIDLAEDNADDLAGFLDGSVPIARAGHAGTATTAGTASSASTATSAGSATSATSAGTAQTAGSATTADHLTTARKINGVDFDGTADITVVDSTKVSNNEDFILIDQENLTFINNICQINDNKITANSLADVYFTSTTVEVARNAGITVETYAGYIQLVASSTPASTLVATIHIRVA